VKQREDRRTLKAHGIYLFQQTVPGGTIKVFASCLRRSRDILSAQGKFLC
jgi:hypothetical protein